MLVPVSLESQCLGNASLSNVFSSPDNDLSFPSDLLTVFSSATPVIGTPSSKRKLPLESGHSFGFSNKKRRSVKKNLGIELLPNALFSGTSTPGSGIGVFFFCFVLFSFLNHQIDTSASTVSNLAQLLRCLLRLLQPTVPPACWNLPRTSYHRLGEREGSRPPLPGGRANGSAADTPSTGTTLPAFRCPRPKAERRSCEPLCVCVCVFVSEWSLEGPAASLPKSTKKKHLASPCACASAWGGAAKTP